jgi:hypothetical protein
LDEALNKSLAVRGMKFLVGHGGTREGTQFWMEWSKEVRVASGGSEEMVFSMVGKVDSGR